MRLISFRSTLVLLIAAVLLAAPGGAAGAARATVATGRPQLFIVGDSVAKLTTPYVLATPLRRIALNWAVPSATSGRALTNLRHGFTPDKSIVVFDAGANDNPERPQVLARHLREAGQVIGDACMIAPTIEPPVDPRASGNGRNEVVFDFAASRPRTLVPEWAGVVEMRPSMRLDSHGLNENEPVSEYRARLMIRAIHRCIAIVANRRTEPPPGKPIWIRPVDQVRRALGE